jgi:hypothetical protein
MVVRKYWFCIRPLSGLDILCYKQENSSDAPPWEFGYYFLFGTKVNYKK